MNTSKGTGSSRTGRQTKRPKTIDLEAGKEEPVKTGTATDEKAAAKEMSGESASSGVPKVKSAEKALPRQPEQPASAKIESSSQAKTAGEKSETTRPAMGSSDTASTGKSGGEADAAGGKGRGPASLFVAGAAGGIIALGLAGVMYAGGLIQPGGGDTANSALRDRVANVESTVDTLRGRVGELAVSQPAGDSEAVQGVTTRMDELEARLGELQENFAGLSDSARQADGDPGFAAAVNDSLMEDFEQRISAAEQTIQELQSGSAQGGDFAAELNQSLMEDFENRMVSAESAIQQLQSGGAGEQPAEAANQNGERIAALSQRTDALETKVGEVETGLTEMREQRTARSESEDRIARSVAANALRTAYERGEPFASLLASVEALTGPLEEARAFDQQARAGVRTTTELREAFSAIASEIISAATPAEGGMVSQLMSNAKSLVRVRPDGPLPGNGPEAIVSRIEDRLENSDLAGAVAEWESLPEPAKLYDPSAQWAEQARERLEADDRLQSILAALQPDGEPTQPDQSQ